MKTKVQNVIRPLDGATSASTIAIHIPRHNGEPVPVPILSTTRLLVARDFSDSHRRPASGMIQTVRSRRQSVAEGNRAGAAPTSSQTEFWSLIMARASFEELLLNYEDFLRQRRITQWATSGLEALAVRGFLQGLPNNRPDLINPADQARRPLYVHRSDHPDPAARVNATIRLIRQTNYLLDQQIDALAKGFVKGRGQQRFDES